MIKHLPTIIIIRSISGQLSDGIIYGTTGQGSCIMRSIVYRFNQQQNNGINTFKDILRLLHFHQFG